MAVQILVLAVLLLVAPLSVGLFFAEGREWGGRLPFLWISGQVLLWAGFQCICVPMILAERTFSEVRMYFTIYTLVLAAAALLYFFLGCRKRRALRPVRRHEKRGKWEIVLWAVFALLLLFQLFMAVFMAYEEGDDAYYVAMSTITVDSDMMYSKLPYTGGTTGLDARHGLAPFPIWVAYLAGMSGMPAVTVAQIGLPLVLIVMAYALYYLIGKKILAKNLSMLPVFMIFAEIMVLFGGYTTYSAENFLLVRTAQGKAVIANIIIPFMLLLLYMLLEKLQREEKTEVKYWLFLALTMLSGCLCSTQGTLLTCMLVGVAVVCAAVCYGKWRILPPMAVCCMIPAGYAVLYFLLG